MPMREQTDRAIENHRHRERGRDENQYFDAFAH
jgi:hypothetical protein